jgi:CheY-like chemotaxis protein
MVEEPSGRRGQSAARRVLVVDDDPDILDALSEILEVEGYEVQRARNGREALQRLERGLPDLVLLDLMMPVMDGWELIKALSQDDRLATLPVVVISALDQDEQLGFRRIKKPFDIDELVKIVAEMCVRRT